MEVLGQQINPAKDKIHNTGEEMKRTKRLQPNWVFFSLETELQDL